MSIQKKNLPGKEVCEVIFILPESITDHPERIAVVGDFNNWDHDSNLMKKTKNGQYKCAVRLPVGKEYHFRYLINETRWENEGENDGFAPAPYENTYNSVVKV